VQLVSQLVGRMKTRCRGELRPRLVEGLQRLNDTLAATPLVDRYWLNGGLLLGTIRDGAPLPGDADVDFSYWDTDRPSLQLALAALLRTGFQRRARWVNNEGRTVAWSLRYKYVKYEFFENTLAGDKLRWYSFRKHPPQEYLNEVPAHGLESIRLFDRQWNKPDDHETYLSSLYGDWRTPDPDYCYWTDSRAIVHRCPWQGGHRW